METQSLQNVIVHHPFWTGIDPRFLPFLNDCATVRCFDADQLIFKERSAASHFYLIHQGQVSLETFVPGRGNVNLQTLNAGEALGWSWLFPPYRWHSTARTLEPSELIALSADELRENASNHPEFGHELLTRVTRVLLQRLEGVQKQLIEFYGPIG